MAERRRQSSHGFRILGQHHPRLRLPQFEGGATLPVHDGGNSHAQHGQHHDKQQIVLVGTTAGAKPVLRGEGTFHVNGGERGSQPERVKRAQRNDSNADQHDHRDLAWDEVVRIRVLRQDQQRGPDQNQRRHNSRYTGDKPRPAFNSFNA